MAGTGTQPACTGGQCGVSPGHRQLRWADVQSSPARQRNTRTSLQDEEGYMVLTESLQDEEGYMVLTESLQDEEGYMVLRESLQDEEDYMVLRESLQDEEDYMVLRARWKSFLLNICPFQDFAQISDSFIQSTCVSRTPTTGQAQCRDWGTNAEQVWPGTMEETGDQPQMQEGLLLLVTTSCWPLFTPSFKEAMQGILPEQEEEKGEATTGLQIIFPRVSWYNLRQF